MPPTSRLLQAVTMPAAIGTERFVLIGVASLLHAKAIGTPPSQKHFVSTYLPRTLCDPALPLAVRARFLSSPLLSFTTQLANRSLLLRVCVAGLHSFILDVSWARRDTLQWCPRSESRFACAHATNWICISIEDRPRPFRPGERVLDCFCCVLLVAVERFFSNLPPAFPCFLSVRGRRRLGATLLVSAFRRDRMMCYSCVLT